MLSTVSMVKIGKVYKNIMVDMIPSNAKLVKRAIDQVQNLTGVDENAARDALEATGNHVKTAVLILQTGVSVVSQARQLLAENEDNLRVTLGKVRGSI